MSKIIVSPVDVFPGTVNLPDFLTLPQVQTYERAMYESRVLIAARVGDVESGVGPDETILGSDIDSLAIPAICEIVESWDITYNGKPLDPPSVKNFPGAPRAAAADLLRWLIDEIGDLYSPEVPEE